MERVGVAITAIVVVVALAAGLVVFHEITDGDFKDEMQHQTEIARAYCHQAFGDSSVYIANVVGGHGGYHCVANDHEPHYHQTTTEARQAAYRANQTGAEVDWSEVERYSDQSPTEQYLSDLVAVAPVAFVIAGGVGVVGLVRRYRADGEGDR